VQERSRSSMGRKGGRARGEKRKRKRRLSRVQREDPFAGRRERWHNSPCGSRGRRGEKGEGREQIVHTWSMTTSSRPRAKRGKEYGCRRPLKGNGKKKKKKRNSFPKTSTLKGSLTSG